MTHAVSQDRDAAGCGQPKAPDSGQIFIGRQPILDRREQVVAYELLYRDSLESRSAVFSNVQVASTRTLVNTFAALGPDAVLGPYTGFVNVDRETLLEGLADALPRERVTIEILETIEADEAVVCACRRLQRAGFSLALDDYVSDDPRQALLDCVDWVKVDIVAVEPRRLPQLVRRLRRGRAQLLAEKVETREDFERCRELGFERFQGYYFARPTVIAGTRIDPARAALLRLLAQIHQDVDTDELCDTIKPHPNIGVNVLRLVNSAAMARRQKISSVRQAVTLLGRRQLQRWFNLLLYAGEDASGLSGPLLQTAARRGRLMELLLREATGEERSREDRAFLVGMASMLDALLGLSLPEVVRQLHLDDEIGLALTRGEGRLGALLEIARRIERGDFEALGPLIGDCGISPDQMAGAELDAFRWVHELSQDGT